MQPLLQNDINFGNLLKLDYFRVLSQIIEIKGLNSLERSKY